MNSSKLIGVTIVVVRTLLALLFVFSGFVKAVDPWGSAIKFGEYFSSFGMDWLSGTTYFFAVALSAAEMVLGLMLLFGVWTKISSTLVLLFMSFFTLLTLYIALANPVADCGCFGDALKLTNWQTFAKNAALLLPMSIVVWWWYRKRPDCSFPTCRCRARNFVLTLIFVFVSCGVGVYSLVTLPLIDFLSYKVGVNIPNAMDYIQHGDVETTLIYRDKLSGEDHKFSLSDTTWYDTTRWEYVDTEIVMANNLVEPSITGFALFDYNGDATNEILSDSSVVMICVSDMSNVAGRCKERLTAYVRSIENRARVICVTPASIVEQPELKLDDDIAIHCYNIDATTLKTMLRAKVGVVVLQNGTIVSKKNCSQLK